MAFRGQPSTPNVHLTEMSSHGDARRTAPGVNGFSSVPERTAYSQRDDLMPRYPPDRLMLHPIMTNYIHRRELFPMGIRSARDENEVALCIKDLDTPSFYPSMISLWLIDSFERKDMERDLLTKLLINLIKPKDGMISQDQVLKGFESALSVLEDAVNDAPRAAEFLGRIFAKVILANIVSFSEIGQLIYEGGEEEGRLVEIGLAAEVMGSMLDMIKSEKGDSMLNEIRSGSNLLLEKFRPPGSNKSWRIDKFI
ncbi:UNVERIFIED_CONTAM: Eukaryotic translation initiation factor 4G [Sesamum latifolium]|uniref:Eukaryotic translation initiation factor 4G n=1 Tax=Sesamum latifolium TaxID=2727402 RepID=A0AAW2U2L2_9LAMI